VKRFAHLLSIIVTGCAYIDMTVDLEKSLRANYNPSVFLWTALASHAPLRYVVADTSRPKKRPNLWL